MYCPYIIYGINGIQCIHIFNTCVHSLLHHQKDPYKKIKKGPRSWHTPHRRPCAFEHFLTLFRVLALLCYITCCYAADGVGWGGVGGHVNVPRTSYIQYCHAAEISGIVYYVTCCYAADGVGWGGVGGHVNVPFTSYIQYCHAAEISGIVYYVTCCYAAGGVGWGGVGRHVLSPIVSELVFQWAWRQHQGPMSPNQFLKALQGLLKH